ncbi:MAG: beta-propeller domain-containing protein [Ruminococcus sp.]|nr:beta-propeller domain-containing protein [Ruminococcus sp.]
MNNDKEIREILESEEVPEELSPENIRIMLNEKASAKKRKKISVAGRITATAAACAIIVGATAGSLHLLRNKDNIGDGFIGDYTPNSNYSGVSYDTRTDESGNSYAVSSADTVTVEQVDAPYMNHAESYEQIYKLIEKSNKKAAQQYRGYNHVYFDAIEETADESPMAFDSDDTNSDTKYFTQTTGAETGGMGIGGEEIETPEPIIAPVENEPITEPVTEESTEPATATEEMIEPTTEEPTEPTTEETTKSATETENDEDDDYSETYNQEENVLEADIVKTDGKKIYYLTNKWITGGYDDDGVYWNYMDNSYNIPVINIASVDKGNFTDSMQIDVTPETYLGDGWEQNIYVNDMYLYNDMIAVIGTINSSCQIDDYDEKYYDEEWKTWYTPYHYEYDNKCFVSFYDKNAELLGTYWQDGWYKDVRIAPDGYMYLVSTYNSMTFEEIGDAENIEKYIPECGIDDTKECMPPEDILLPEKTIDNYGNLSYTIIGSIDLTVSAQFTPADSKALAGYTGELYTSAENIYTTVGWENTDITRISVSGGNITPVASGTVEGYVKDQFSMSEYDGYFRIATTVNKWTDNSNFFTDMLGISTSSEHIQDNRVYVLDMDLNQVGCVSGFGENETIKSVNFSGNMGYVVTYEQTDPLFAIDLSNPAEPFITDEFKILGYSTYMQNWTDGLLLGFGIDADENGIENGVKLVMFDNSDPYNLQEVGLYSINRTDDTYVYSPAAWERKQLLIAPEKNIIGIPLSIYNYNDSDNYDISKYMFFEYADGEFIPKGEISKTISYNDNYDRALYIGGYVYVVSADKFVSADIETITITDEVDF